MTDQQPARPYAHAAADYLATGLGIPVPLNGKILQVGGVTGDEGHASGADVDRWLDRYGAANVGLVLDETVVALDVDHGYTGHDGRIKHGNDTLAGHEALLGPLPPTVSSTSRNDTHPLSRIRYYRVTAADGAALRGNVDLRLPDQRHGDVEVIHHRYRYVAVWPSVHPDTGDTYDWYNPAGERLDSPPNADFDLPDLPEPWVRHLVGLAVAKRGTSYGKATPAEIDATLNDGEMDADLGEIVRRFWTENIAHGHGAEDESDLLGMTSRLARLATAGRPGSRTAVELCRAGYTRPPYTDDTYGRAFDAALAGSVKFWTKWNEEADVIRGALFPDTTPATVTEPTRVAQVSGEDEPAVATAVTPDTTPTPPSAQLSEYEQLYERQVAEEVQRRLVRAEAERRVQERDAAQVTLPRKVRLDAFLDEPDEDPTWRVDGVWPTGGNIVLSAPAKSGKSHMVANLIRSLADGDPFLGRYEPAPARVVYLDDELDERTWRRWLREQDVQNTSRVELVPLRGNLATFDVLNPAVRSAWADLLRGADVLVFDCLRPALDALRLDESHDAGVFLVALDQLKAEAGVGEMLVVHHAGHNPTRARGDSRILDWPDASWKIIPALDDDGNADPSQPREFCAFGRDVDIPRTVINYDQDTRQMTLGDRSSADAQKADVVAAVVAHVAANPGVIQKDLVAAVRADTGVGRDAVFNAIQQAVRQSRLLTGRGENNAVTYQPYGFQ